MQQLHDGMNVRVKISGDLTDPLAVTRGVKQGCTLVPSLFNAYVQCITLLIGTSQLDNTRVNINYRMTRSLFDKSKLEARTKTSRQSFSELQYAGDCALLSHSPDDQQAALQQMAHLYERIGLQMNVLAWRGVSPCSYKAVLSQLERHRVALMGRVLLSLHCRAKQSPETAGLLQYTPVNKQKKICATLLMKRLIRTMETVCLIIDYFSMFQWKTQTSGTQHKDFLFAIRKQFHWNGLYITAF